jgi:hypothetical protein
MFKSEEKKKVVCDRELDFISFVEDQAPENEEFMEDKLIWFCKECQAPMDEPKFAEKKPDKRSFHRRKKQNTSNKLKMEKICVKCSSNNVVY